MQVQDLMRKQLLEGEQLIRRQSQRLAALDKVLVEGQGGTAMDDWKKTQIAQSLHNLEVAMETRKSLHEAGAQVQDFATKNDYMNLVTIVMGTSIVDKIAQFITMKQKVSIGFYLANEFDQNKGSIRKGDNINSMFALWKNTPAGGYDEYKDNAPGAIHFTTEHVSEEMVVLAGNGVGTLEFTQLRPGSFTAIGVFEGTEVLIRDNGNGNFERSSDEGVTWTTFGSIDYADGSINMTANVTLDPENPVVNYDIVLDQAPISADRAPRVKPTVKDITLRARPRKVISSFSIDAAFDLMATQAVDLKKISSDLMVQEFRSEIDGSVLDAIFRTKTDLYVEFNTAQLPGVSRHDHLRDFLEIVIVAANSIFQRTRRARGNVLIVGEKAANIVEYSDLFKPAKTLGQPGPHIMGTLGGRFLVIRDPYADPDKFAVEYMGDIPFDCAVIFGQYMPPTSTMFIMDSTFEGRQGYAASDCVKVVNPDFIVLGRIVNDPIFATNPTNP